MTNSLPDIIPFPRRATPPSEPALSVLIVSSDTLWSERIATDLHAVGCAVRRAMSIEAALQLLSVASTDVCLLGSLASEESAAHLHSQIQQRGWSTQLLTVVAEAVADGTPRSVTESIVWPCPTITLQALICNAAQKSRLTSDNRRLKRQISNRVLRDMVGHSPAMQTLRQQIQTAAEQPGAVLLCGEAGTGVDVAAVAIHDSSRRGHRPFIKLDCRVLSAETLEAELWGSGRQNLQNGRAYQPGRVELASGGTILLDGIEAAALPVQRRLVALVKQQPCEHPVTGELLRPDVRVLAGTHAKLQQLVERGLFRADLYEALCGTVVELPALRERAEDLGPLSEYFLQRLASREGRPPRALTVDALHMLQKWHWPGNIRELENVLERACGIDCGQRLTASMLEPWINREVAEDENADLVPGLTLADMERKLIEATFTRFAGNRERTARALQIGIRTLSGKLREYGYPPRGGPGSNIIPMQPALELESELRAA